MTIRKYASTFSRPYLSSSTTREQGASSIYVTGFTVARTHKSKYPPCEWLVMENGKEIARFKKMSQAVAWIAKEVSE